MSEKEQIRHFVAGDTISYGIQLKDKTDHPFPMTNLIGGPLVLFYFLQEAHDKSQALIQAFKHHFDDFKLLGASVCAICPESPEVIRTLCEKYALPYQVLSDETMWVARDLGIASWETAQGKDTIRARCGVFLCDGTLRVRELLFPERLEEMMSHLYQALPVILKHQEQAPILQIPMVFEPALCEKMFSLWNNSMMGKADLMSEQEKKDVSLAIDLRLGTRIAPRLKTAFRYQPQFREPPRIWCHEDLPLNQFFNCNADVSSKHREFGIMIALQCVPVEGGTVEFTEYGPTRYTVKTGEALVFSCDLLQRIFPVTQGQRFWYITFLHSQEQLSKQHEQALRGAVVGGHLGGSGAGAPAPIVASDKLF